MTESNAADPSNDFDPGWIGEALEIAVPFQIAKVLQWSPERRQEQRRANIERTQFNLVMAEFFTPEEVEERPVPSAFARLSEQIALAALEPGGVTFEGRHWEVK